MRKKFTFDFVIMTRVVFNFNVHFSFNFYFSTHRDVYFFFLYFSIQKRKIENLIANVMIKKKNELTPLYIYQRYNHILNHNINMITVRFRKVIKKHKQIII